MISIQIFGAGAIGAFLTASFASSGYDVALVARATRCAHLRETGINFERAGRVMNVPLAIYSDCVGLPRPDLAILCTKTKDLEAVLKLLDVYAENPPLLVTVQNGLDAPRWAADHFPNATVLASRVHGFFEMEDNLVRHVGVEPLLQFGCWNRDDADAARLLSKVLTLAGVQNRISGDIRHELWEKFLLASAVGGVGAALGIPVGQIMRDAAGRDFLAAAMREIYTLALVRGVHLPDDCVETTLDFVASFPADATSSLQRDLEAHRPSEFDDLTGAVLRMAQESDVDLPVHRRIVQMIGARGLIDQ